MWRKNKQLAIQYAVARCTKNLQKVSTLLAMQWRVSCSRSMAKIMNNPVQGLFICIYVHSYNKYYVPL